MSFGGFFDNSSSGNARWVKMEWRKSYLDLMLVPLGFLVTIAYHIWLWHKVRTQPLTTVIGTNSIGRRLWVSSIMKLYGGILMLVLLCVGTVTAVPTPLRPNVPSTTDAPTHLVFFTPPPPPPSPSPPSPAAPPTHHRPRPWVVTMIVVSILGAVGSGGGLYYFIRRRSRMTEPHRPQMRQSIQLGTQVVDTAAAVRDAIAQAFGGAFGGEGVK